MYTRFNLRTMIAVDEAGSLSSYYVLDFFKAIFFTKCRLDLY